jgi:hypothetical protein
MLKYFESFMELHVISPFFFSMGEEEEEDTQIGMGGKMMKDNAKMGSKWAFHWLVGGRLGSRIAVHCLCVVLAHHHQPYRVGPSLTSPSYASAT